jgi:putative flippase GtrA
MRYSETIKMRLSRNGLFAQMVRYGISGLVLTGLFSLVYEAILFWHGAKPQLANTCAFVVTVIFGYLIHSRWSFQGHGNRDAPVRNTSRFLAVNLAGFALNSFWVWVVTKRLGLSPHLPLIPIVLITPWLSFWLNRRWTFG